MSTLDRMHAQLRELHSISLNLDILGQAFAVSGNTLAANKLGKLADRVEQAEREFNSALVDQINERLEDGQKSSRAMLAAALAGVGLKEGEG